MPRLKAGCGEVDEFVETGDVYIIGAAKGDSAEKQPYVVIELAEELLMQGWEDEQA